MGVWRASVYVGTWLLGRVDLFYTMNRETINGCKNERTQK